MDTLCSHLTTVVVAAALLACRGAPTSNNKAEESASATPPSPAAAASVPAPRWNATAPDIVGLAAAWNGTSAPAGVDDTGLKLTIRRFNVPGWSLVSIASFKKRPEAKSLSLEGGHCEPERFGERVTLMHSDGSLPMQAQWFKISGGPFSGLIMKAFTNDKTGCIFHLTTVAYAVEAGWKAPPHE